MNSPEQPPNINAEQESKQEAIVDNSPAENESKTEETTIENTVGNLLLNKGIITEEEASTVDSSRLDELMVRTAHDFEDLPETIPPKNAEKTRRILGLNPQTGTPPPEQWKRESEKTKITQEMNVYLEKFKQTHPEVTGMIICGSQMDVGKVPTPDSDIDIVLITEDNIQTNSNTEEGRTTVEKLRSFTDKHQSQSGLEVEPDEFYTKSELLEALKSDSDKSKLTWGWNPNAVKYIGSDIDEMDDLQLQIHLMKELNSTNTQAMRQKVISEAKETIAKHLSAEPQSQETKMQTQIGELDKFDMEYFKQLEGEDGWVAIGQDNCKNQQYFTVKSTADESVGIIGVYDTENEKNVSHTVIDPAFRGQRLASKLKPILMEKLGLDFLTLTIDLDNTASIKSTEKLLDQGLEKVSDKDYENEFHKAKYIFRQKIND